MKNVQRVLYGIWSVTLLLGACGKGKDEPPQIPAHILPLTQMAQVSALVYQIEAANNMNLIESKATGKDFSFYAAEFKALQVTPEQYQTSLNYYQTQPALLDSMYALTLAELSRKASGKGK